MKPSKMSLLFALSILGATGVKAGAQNNDGSYAWPYLIVSGRDSIWLYQPQGITWHGQQLQGSEAVSIRTAGESQEKYGVVWFNATTNDAGNGRITLSDYSITRQNFPSMSDNGSALVQAITSNAGALPIVSQQKLQDDISLGKQNPEAGLAQGVAVKNDPPAIIHSSDPALLIMIDGQPRLTPVAGTDYQRILNTNYLILVDGSGNYYTPIGDKWAVTTDLSNANWSVTPNTDPLNDAMRRVQADKSINLSIPDNNADEVSAAAQNGTIPMLYVSQRPAELLLTNGAPDFTPIDGTNLLYAQNAKGDLFKSLDDNRTYTLISGRWYSAPQMEGPWTWVDPSQLPADFSKIPQNSPESRVLVSVPNTNQANEALIANTIPQTATVKRSQADLTVNYDGDPKFKPIANTDLEYAPNASAPVIRDGDEFYACEKAVWFESSSPMGPWTVASHVPDEIYAIPSNSPVYNVTYVKVYDADNDDVTFGYTPGYFGIYNAYWGVPVYGTGWWYRPWIGAYWYPPPFTYGFGVTFGWTPYIGFGAFFNFGFGYYCPIYRPYWGPWAWYHPYYPYYPYAHPYYGYGGYYHGGPVVINRVNIYNSWNRPGFVRVNNNPIGAAPGRFVRNNGGQTAGTGTFRPGNPGNQVNAAAYSRGNIYSRGYRPTAGTTNQQANGSVYNRMSTNNGGGFGQSQMQSRTNNPFNAQGRPAQGGGNNLPTPQQQRTYQPQGGGNNLPAPQQRSYQPQAGGRTYQPQQQPMQRQAPARSYSAPSRMGSSAPAFRGGGGSGAFHGGGGGGGSHGGGGGGGRGGRH